jgi:hypothetical protein
LSAPRWPCDAPKQLDDARQPEYLQGRMRFRRLCLVALLACLVMNARTLAYASPPDPGWIDGLWDDADYDDVVILLVSSATEAIQDDTLPDGRSFLTVGGIATTTDDEPIVQPPPLSSRPRAPPAR